MAEQISFIHKWFGKKKITKYDLARLQTKIGFYKVQHFKIREERVLKRLETQKKYESQNLSDEGKFKLRQYQEKTGEFSKEVEALKEILSIADTCSMLVEHIIDHAGDIQDEKENHKMVDLKNKFSNFANDCEEFGITDKSGLNTDIRKLQLKAIKPSFDKIWNYLLKITS